MEIILVKDLLEVSVEDLQDQVRWMRGFARINAWLAGAFLAVSITGWPAGSWVMTIVGAFGVAAMLSLATIVHQDADRIEREIEMREAKR